MLKHQIFNYFETEARPVSGITAASEDFFLTIKSLQCDDGLITILPSIIYLIGIALLVHHVIIMNIRPQLYRRVGRELLLQVPWQEILILMLIYHCIRIWLSTLMMLNTVFKFYQKQKGIFQEKLRNFGKRELLVIARDFGFGAPKLFFGALYYEIHLTRICPTGIAFSSIGGLKINSIAGISKCCRDAVKVPFIILYILTGLAPFNRLFDVTYIDTLHPLVLSMLVPKFMKVCICTALSFLPLVAVIKLKERRSLPQFMLWMAPVRRDRSELGASGYYLERPFSEVTINSVFNQIKRSNSCSGISNMKLLKPKKLRARKSVSV